MGAPAGEIERRIQWRLADVFSAQARFDEAEMHLAAAQRGFEELLTKYPLAFADHAAEFYAGSGGNCRRALELARANAANRPTRRALEQVQAIEAKCTMAPVLQGALDARLYEVR